MRLTIAAVGKLKDGGERALLDRYVTRLSAARATGFGPLAVAEIPEARQATAPERRADEAGRLLKAVSAADIKVALDERGKALTSREFATWLAARRDEGCRHMAFLIGGPDGHGAQTLSEARLKLSLGVMTLPHGLARVVLAEQLYRAATIASGHPYHRD